MQLCIKSGTFHGHIFRILQHFDSKLCNFTDFNMHFVTVVKDVPRSKFSLLWVSVKNRNRNERSRNGNDQNRKRPPNFPHKIFKNENLCGKLGGRFRFRSFPFRIRSFRFSFFTETRLLCKLSTKSIHNLILFRDPNNIFNNYTKSQQRKCVLILSRNHRHKFVHMKFKSDIRKETSVLLLVLPFLIMTHISKQNAVEHVGKKMYQ